MTYYINQAGLKVGWVHCLSCTTHSQYTRTIRIAAKTHLFCSHAAAAVEVTAKPGRRVVDLASLSALLR